MGRVNNGFSPHVYFRFSKGIKSLWRALRQSKGTGIVFIILGADDTAASNATDKISGGNIKGIGAGDSDLAHSGGKEYLSAHNEVTDDRHIVLGIDLLELVSKVRVLLNIGTLVLTGATVFLFAMVLSSSHSLSHSLDSRYCRQILQAISNCQVANRPGRLEPRVVKKRRQDQYTLMAKPRNELHKRLPTGGNSFE